MDSFPFLPLTRFKNVRGDVFIAFGTYSKQLGKELKPALTVFSYFYYI
jgi:hypothetical protein